MKKSQFPKKIFTHIICFVLIATTALSVAGCKDSDSETSVSETSAGTGTEASEVGENVLGQGAHHFTFTVTADGSETVCEIKTDKTTVGEALQQLGLISGEEGPYGLYVKTVNGITADYDTDKTYWSFYINGEYAMSGVDVTQITDGASYAFKKEKG